MRFIQVYSGGGPLSMQWDAHKHLKQNHEKMAGHSDVPIAALLEDLKRRGLLEKTLVIWGAEFGRLRPPRPVTAATTTRTATRCGSREGVCAGAK